MIVDRSSVNTCADCGGPSDMYAVYIDCEGWTRTLCSACDDTDGAGMLEDGDR